MAIGTGLSIAAFSLATHNYLAQLISADIMIDADDVETKGAAQRYDHAQNVKQGQKIPFKVEFPGGAAEGALSNLDITVFSIGGVDRIATFRGGSIKATTKTVDPKIAGNGYKTPVPVGTGCVVDGEFVIEDAAAFVTILGTGADVDFNVAMVVTYGTETYTSPGLLTSASHSMAREEIQVEKCTLKQRGAPTGPTAAVTSLLGEILLGTAVIGVDIDSGFNEYTTATAVIADITVTLTDAAIIEMSGTLEIQGALAIA